MLLTSFIVAFVFYIAFPLAVGYFLWKRYRTSWKFFAFGALIFFVSQILVRIPIIVFLTAAINPASLPEAQQWLWIAGASFTAGVFEESGRWLGYRFLFKAPERLWRNALMFGAGHGGIEAMLLVGGSVLGTIIALIQYSNVDLATSGLNPQAVQQIQSLLGTPAYLPFVGVIERVFTAALHIALSVMVLQAFRRRNGLWVLWAILFHGFANFLAAGVAMRVPGGGYLLAEVVIAVFALISLWIIRHFREDARDSGLGDQVRSVETTG